MIDAGAARALLARMEGAFVQRIHAGDELLALELRSPGRSELLALSIAPGASGIALVDRAPLARATGALRSFRDHARGVLTGLRLADARVALRGRVLVLGFEGAEGRADLVLDAAEKPNLAIVRAGESHALRRPHEREGLPEEWIAAPAESAPGVADLDALSRDLLAHRERRLAASRLRARLRELRTAHAAARRLVLRRRDDVAGLGDPGKKRALADALAAVLHLVKQGDDRVSVTRLDDGTTHSMALDPRLPPGANLRKCYGSAARAERGAEQAGRLLQEAVLREAALDDCSSQARELADALGDREPTADELDEIAELLRHCERLLPHRPEKEALREDARRKLALPEGVREFTSADGLRILAGKSATANDALTFRIARGNDAWLHARDVPGPHVVLVVPKAMEIPQESLLDAATVAHVLGKLGSEPRGEVVWTRAKDVRRAKGAGPGKVTITRERVLSLRVEPARVARLRLRW